jgi:outer membrane protein assembly factor BamD
MWDAVHFRPRAIIGKGRHRPISERRDMSFTRFSFPRLVAIAVLLGGSLGLAGCADDPIGAAVYIERPVEQIYNDAWVWVEEGEWIFAGIQFSEVERQHPYSIWARRSLLMSSFSFYMANRYGDSIQTANTFIQLHPGNRDVPYAYYLKAVSLYEQIVDINRDQARTSQALAALQDLVQRYPDSEYARDARLKIDLARDHLAGKEMTIGRFYLRQGNPLASIIRFRTVVDDYQTTSHTPEALERLTEAYLTLGMIREAQASAAVLGHNYPGSEWYQDAYTLLVGTNAAPVAAEQGWFGRTLDSVF